MTVPEETRQVPPFVCGVCGHEGWGGAWELTDSDGLLLATYEVDEATDRLVEFVHSPLDVYARGLDLCPPCAVDWDEGLGLW